jgi:pilus assembly protein CpaF
MGVADLIKLHTLSPEMAELAEACVLGRLNILVSGGTGTGKTTLLNVLSAFIPDKERIVSIEDAVELQLQQEHVVRLESRPPNVEGRGEVTIRDLVKNSLRMRPDRIIVGECRGGEALDMLQAMNTGHDGSLSTIHANTSRDAMARLETLVLMAGMDLPLRAIREQVASAIDVIIQLTRLRDGTRRVTALTEIVGMEGQVLSMQDIYAFDYSAGVSADGKFLGKVQPTGIRPLFVQKLTDLGIKLSPGIFGSSSMWEPR